MSYGKRMICVISSLFLLAGCQSQGHKNMAPSSTPKHTITQQKQIDQTNSPTSSGTPDKQQDIDRRKQAADQTYENNLPGKIPATSTAYTLTLDATKGFVPVWRSHHSDFVGLFDHNNNEQPQRLITPKQQKGVLIYSNIPSASKAHMDVISIPVKEPGHKMNAPTEIYTNDQMKAHHQLAVIMGKGMGGSYDVVDSNGHTVKDSTLNMDLGGSWYTIQTGTWYRMVYDGPDRQQTLMFRFKMEIDK